MPNAFTTTEEFLHAQAILRQLRVQKVLPPELLQVLQTFLNKFEEYNTTESYLGDDQWLRTDLTIPTQNLIGLTNMLEFLKQNPQIVSHKQGSLKELEKLLSNAAIDNENLVPKQDGQTKSKKYYMLDSIGVTLGMFPLEPLSAKDVYVQGINIISSPQSFASEDFGGHSMLVLNALHQQLDKFEQKLLIEDQHNDHDITILKDIVKIATQNLLLYVNILKFLQDNPQIFSDPKQQENIAELKKAYMGIKAYLNDIGKYGNAQLPPLPLEKVAAGFGLPKDAYSDFNYLAKSTSKPLAEQYPLPPSFLRRLWNKIVNFFHKLFSATPHKVSLQTTAEKINANVDTVTTMAQTTKPQAAIEPPEPIETIEQTIDPKAKDNLDLAKVHRVAYGVIANVRKLFTPHAKTGSDPKAKTKTKTKIESPEDDNKPQGPQVKV